MFVVKRDGRKEPVHFDKITARITKLSYGLNPDFCDPVGASDGSSALAILHDRLTQNQCLASVCQTNTALSSKAFPPQRS